MFGTTRRALSLLQRLKSGKASPGAKRSVAFVDCEREKKVSRGSFLIPDAQRLTFNNGTDPLLSAAGHQPLNSAPGEAHPLASPNLRSRGHSKGTLKKECPF